MARRSVAIKRELLPDPRFGEAIISRMCNSLMSSGKRSLAQGIIYGALDKVADKTKRDPIEVLKKAIENTRPLVEVKSRRVGGANYQVPVEVRPTRRDALSLRWIVEAARARGKGEMAEKLSEELIDAYNKRGAAVKKRDDVHRMAEANKAFAHYRW